MCDKKDDWETIFEEVERGKRPHAGFFTFETNKPVAELGVLEIFAEAYKKAGLGELTNFRHRGAGNDPPDCEAMSSTGERVGIEITELVDPRSAKAARAGKPYNWKDWSKDLVIELRKIVEKKDKPADLKGGPYPIYFLLVHTDEPWLEIDHARQVIANGQFPQTTTITRAFMLISYSPAHQGYPLIEIPLNVPNKPNEGTPQTMQ